MKKALLLFLSLSIMIMSVPFTANASSAVVPEITSYGFMTVDGKVITTLGGETEVKAYVDIDNKNHITNNNLGNLVATCTVDGIIVSTTTLPITVDSNTYLKRMETNAINVPIGSTNVVFKVFIMDTMQNIRPVVDMYRWGTNPNAVNDGTKYADAIKTTTVLGIMNGYEDGSFRAEGNLTRAEFAAIMVRLLGKESLAQNAMGSTTFTDVSSLNWASGYINLVAPLDFMDGYEDGRFGPDNNITLEQGIKGLVTALGYAPTVGVLGYPLGYIDKANEIGITKNISLLGKDIVSRGVLAKLIANSLEIPLYENGYGIYDRKTILSEYIKLVKLQIIVNSYEGFSSNSNGVNVTILNNYRTKYYDEFCRGSYNLDAGTSNISKLVGSKAIVFVAYDDSSSDTPVVISAYKDITNPSELTVLSENIELTSTFSGITTVEYWANTTDKATTKITLPTSAKYYVNGTLTANPPYLMNVYGSITFVKNDTATIQDYDTIFITNYTNFVVDTVNTSTFRATSKNGVSSISFDPADTTIKSTLYEINGKEMNWSDLKENDVVSCKIVNGDKRVTIGTLVNNKVIGQIVEIENNDIYTINGNQYKVDPAMSNSLALADQGAFYLDILGRICYLEIDVPAPNYAYVIAASLSTGIESITEMKLFNKNGEIITRRTSSKVKLDGISNISTVDLTKAPYNFGAGQFITYSVNSSGDITSIDRANTSYSGIIGITGLFAKYGAVPTSQYLIASKTLTTNYSNVYLTDKTVVMVAPAGSTDENDYKLVNVNSIVNEQLFNNVSFFDVNANREVGAVLIQIPVTILPPVEPPVVEPLTEIFATVTGTSTALNIDGESIIKLKVLQNGVATTLIGSTDLTTAPIIGATIIPVKNDRSDITSFATLSIPNDYAKTVSFTTPMTANISYTYGLVTERRTSNISTTGGDFAVPTTANVYIYDERSSSSSNRVTLGSITDFNASISPYNGMTTYDDDVSKVYAIAREYNGRIIDVVIYIFK